MYTDSAAKVLPNLPLVLREHLQNQSGKGFKVITEREFLSGVAGDIVIFSSFDSPTLFECYFNYTSLVN